MALALFWSVKGGAQPVLHAADTSIYEALEHAGWVRRPCGKGAALTCYAGLVAPAWVVVGWADVVTLLMVLFSAPERYPLMPLHKRILTLDKLGGALLLLAFVILLTAAPVWLFTGIPWGAGTAFVLACYGVWRQQVPEVRT